MSIPCIVVTSRPEALADFLKGLTVSGELAVEVAKDGTSALEMVKAADPGVVVVDEELPDRKPLALVVDVLMTSAMFNTAMITSMMPRSLRTRARGTVYFALFLSSPVKRMVKS